MIGRPCIPAEHREWSAKGKRIRSLYRSKLKLKPGVEERSPRAFFFFFFFFFFSLFMKDDNSLGAEVLST